VATGIIPDAPALPQQPWDASAIYPTSAPTEIRPTQVVIETAQPTPTPVIAKIAGPAQDTAAFNILFGVISSLIVCLAMFVIVIFRGRHS
jgi:hypothetical protein